MTDKSMRVAVLGAGPMGLAVAYQLVQDGYRPVVYEAAGRIGGMAVSFDFGGLDIERFYHFHCTSDTDLETLLKELGIHERLKWRETKMGYFFEGRLQAWGNPMALLRFRGLGPVAKFRSALHAFLALKRRDWFRLDRVEATEWLRRWVGEEAYEKLWRRLFEYKFYDEAQNLSAAWIWARIRRIGTSRYNLMREKLGYLEGGSQTYLDAIGAAIEAGGADIRLNTPVRKVCMEDDRVTGIETEAGFEQFDRVISTVPLPYVPRMMPDLPDEIRSMYEAQRNVAVVCVIVRLRRKLTENFWLNVNHPDMDIPGLVEYSNLRPMDGHVVYAPFYMPGEHPKYAEDNTVFVEKVRRYLKIINPDLTDADFIDIHASRYRYSQPVCGPRFLETLPPAKLPVEGLWVADTSYYYPEDRGISESTGFGRRMAREAVGLV
jgi:protoporphyrinogen oxidase